MKRKKFSILKNIKAVLSSEEVKKKI